jgi:hypothetical protein
MNDTPRRQTLNVVSGIAIVAGLAALGFIAALVVTPSRWASTGTGLLPAKAVPASVTYRQNSNPDYVNFAYAYGALMGAPDYAITSNLDLSRTLADSLCGQLRKGVSEAEMVTRLTGSGSGEYALSAADARGVVDSAHILVCSGK